MAKRLNIVRGGVAIPVRRNTYLLKGRTHEQGGIDIGSNPRTGIEAETDEIVQIGKNNMRVFSSVPFLRGKSPAQRVMGGENPNKVFNAQESFKRRNRINDDGTRKKRFGDDIEYFNMKKKARLGTKEETEEPSFFDKVLQAASAIKNKISSFFNDDDKGEVIPLTGRYVDRVTANDNNVSSILTNEFVEGKPNTIRRAGDFVNTADTLLGDRKIPLSKISNFYGTENGKLKAGNIKTFNDTTTVVPVRNKNVGKIKKVLLGNKERYESLRRERSRLYRTIDNNAAKEYAHNNNLSPDLIDIIMYGKDNAIRRKVVQTTKGWAYVRNSVNNNKDLHDLDAKISAAESKYVTDKNDTIPATLSRNKTLFADEEGNSMFVNNLRKLNEEQLQQLNDSLSKHSMYPIQVDNGRYYRYYKETSPISNYRTYTAQDFWRPEKALYVIGTKNKKKMGGLRKKAELGTKGEKSSIWDKIDDAADTGEKVLGVANFGTSMATLAAPNPYTLAASYITGLGGAGIDLYQGVRGAIKGDWRTVGKNAADIGMSLIGLRALKEAKRLRELDKALRASGAPRQYVTKTIGRGRGRHRYTTTKENSDANTNEAIGFASIPAGLGLNFADMNERPHSPFVFNKQKKMGGLSRSKDYGSKAKPYPSVDKKDFAGGHRSYPIPTKADARDALRLAGLHGRSDVKAKVYRKYPELRKKAPYGTFISLTGNVKNGLMHVSPTGGQQKKYGGRRKAKFGNYIPYKFKGVKSNKEYDELVSALNAFSDVVKTSGANKSNTTSNVTNNTVNNVTNNVAKDTVKTTASVQPAKVDNPASTSNTAKVVNPANNPDAAKSSASNKGISFLKKIAYPTMVGLIGVGAYDAIMIGKMLKARRRILKERQRVLEETKGETNASKPAPTEETKPVSANTRTTASKPNPAVEEELSFGESRSVTNEEADKYINKNAKTVTVKGSPASSASGTASSSKTFSLSLSDEQKLASGKTGDLYGRTDLGNRKIAATKGRLRHGTPTSEVESRRWNKMYKRVMGNKEPGSGFGQKPEPKVITYTPTEVNTKYNIAGDTYDPTAEFNQYRRMGEQAYRQSVGLDTKKPNKVSKAKNLRDVMKNAGKAAKNMGKNVGKGLNVLGYLGFFRDLIDAYVESKEYNNLKDKVEKANKGEAQLTLEEAKRAGELKLPVAMKYGGSIRKKALMGDKLTHEQMVTLFPAFYGKRRTFLPSIGDLSDNLDTGLSLSDLGEMAAMYKPASSNIKAEMAGFAIPSTSVNDKITSKPVQRHSIIDGMNPYMVKQLMGMNRKYDTERGKVKRNDTERGKVKRNDTERDDDRYGRYKDYSNWEDAIGLTSNVIGGLVSHAMNRNMLNRMKYMREPIALPAAKLKTGININPQLDSVREAVSAYERDVDANTASSRVALARKQRARLAALQQANELRGYKENTETSLINKDRLNQQQTAQANVESYNKWLEGKTGFENTLLEKKAENDVGLVQNINAGLQDLLARRESRQNERQTIAAMALANPDLPVEMFAEQGLISPRILRAYRKAYPLKNKKG